MEARRCGSHIHIHRAALTAASACKNNKQKSVQQAACTHIDRAFDAVMKPGPLSPAFGWLMNFWPFMRRQAVAGKEKISSREIIENLTSSALWQSILRQPHDCQGFPTKASLTLHKSLANY